MTRNIAWRDEMIRCLQSGAVVNIRTPSGVRPARIVDVDANHYQARINGRTIYRVRFTDTGEMGSGWDSSDFVD